MTQLSNIFIGNKVVKQAFLNDAIIYQSKGWEPTASTMQRVFTKSYTEIPDPGSTISVKVDSKGNIVIAGTRVVYKTDSDGKLLWQKAIFTSNSNFRITSMIVAKNDNIFYSASDASFAQIDSNTGEIVKKVDLNSKYNIKSISVMSADNNQIYAIAGPPINFLDIDFNGNIVRVTPWNSTYNNLALRSMATGNSKYNYVEMFDAGYIRNAYAFKLDKSNPNSYVNIVYNQSASSSSEIAVDSLGNAYITYSGGLYKYLSESGSGPVWGVESPFSNHGGYFEQLAVDQQDNVYAFDRYNIYKYSSDGTFLWKSSVNTGISEMVCDKNNLITSGDKLTKFLSLVKKS